MWKNSPGVINIFSCDEFQYFQSIFLETSEGMHRLWIYFLHITWWPTRQIWGIWKLRPAFSPETPNLGQNQWVLYRVTLKFDGWPWKTKGHLSFSVSSFVHHFIAIGEFKLELQSGNAQFGSNSTIFRAVWPWNLTYDLEQGKCEGFDSCDLPSNLTQIGFKSSIFRPCDLEIWWMTAKNNKARLLYYIKP